MVALSLHPSRSWSQCRGATTHRPLGGALGGSDCTLGQRTAAPNKSGVVVGLLSLALGIWLSGEKGPLTTSEPVGQTHSQFKCQPTVHGRTKHVSVHGTAQTHFDLFGVYCLSSARGMRYSTFDRPLSLVRNYLPPSIYSPLDRTIIL